MGKRTVVVENRRVAGGGVVQRHVFYLGELNDNQQTESDSKKRFVPSFSPSLFLDIQ